MPSPIGDGDIEPEQEHGPVSTYDGTETQVSARDTSRPSPIRQSSISKAPPDGVPRTPRTPNRVRFDLDLVQVSRGLSQDASIERSPDSQTTSPLIDGEDDTEDQNVPLLTGQDAPSVTVAHDLEWAADELGDINRPKSGMHHAFLNMANSIIGAGIIGQPYAFRQAGLLTGIILLVGLTITVDWTIRLIVINSKLSGANSFQGTVERCFGKPGLITISIAQLAFAFGGMIAFCIIVGDTIPHVLAAVFPKLSEMPFLWLLTNRKAIIVLLISVISYPLSLYRDIAKLAKASGLALISMTIIVITIISQGATVSQELRGALRGSLLIKPGITSAIGIISFAFVCHHNSLLIYGSLQKPTLDRFAQVTHFSTLVSMIACMAVALAGFLTFGDKTMGNVLNNFPTNNVMVNIARLCFGLNMLTTLPLECFVCREVILNYWCPGKPFNLRLHVIITTSLVVASIAVALITCDLGAVFELVGATSACALAYILPPLCFIRLTNRSYKTYLAGACAVFGCIVLVISIVQAVIKLITLDGEGHPCV